MAVEQKLCAHCKWRGASRVTRFVRICFTVTRLHRIGFHLLQKETLPVQLLVREQRCTFTSFVHCSVLPIDGLSDRRCPDIKVGLCVGA